MFEGLPASETIPSKNSGVRAANFDCPALKNRQGSAISLGVQSRYRECTESLGKIGFSHRRFGRSQSPQFGGIQVWGVDQCLESGS